MSAAIYILFFLSGLSGLIYQVVWVRVLGTVFGSTVYSAALVVAVFMLGLGVGSRAIGAIADRRHQRAPERLLSDYGYLELAIGLLGLTIAAAVPHLGPLTARFSTYVTDGNGWHVLSRSSLIFRAAICTLIIAPATVAMGATLTVLIRYVTRHDLRMGSRRVALLYAANTLGAAAGALLADYALVPWYGLRATQSAAALLNFAAAGAVLVLSMRRRQRTVHVPEESRPVQDSSWRAPSIALVSLALVCTGFATIGMEIIWFRHFTLLLGSLRAVYAMLLAIILLGMGVGSLAGASIVATGRRPLAWFAAAQGLFVVATLWGLTRPSTRVLSEAAVEIGGRVDITSAAARWWAEMWFNARPMIAETFLPAVLMGLTFPLANALVQRDARLVGRRAGWLYLASTAGAVCGSLAAGFVFLPNWGIQASATALSAIAWLSIVPMALADFLGTGEKESSSRRMVPTIAVALATAVSAAMLGVWMRLPARMILERSLIRPSASERLLAMTEGVNEVVAATEYDGDHRRWLLTNGYPMSATGPMEQRYMRALAHIPLLAIEHPERVLVIGFGVGNTTHAATLHRSVSQVEVADLSRDILAYSRYFTDSNHDVLRDSRVSVFVNDGRQHLQMQREGIYDLITLEPPPLAHAGVGALYSKDFYTLARSRLKEGGFISQWLPAYQVPSAVTLSLVRAFLDVFPHAVLLSGAQPNLLLIGAKSSPIEIDPERLEAALRREPQVQDDLARVDMGSVREIVGSFVGSGETLDTATHGVLPVTDDQPLQEYSSRSLINFAVAGVPASIIDLHKLDQWCPRCFARGATVPSAAGLEVYTAILGRAYMVSAPASVDLEGENAREMIAGSTYLKMMLRNAAMARNEMGLRLASQGNVEAAVEQFEEAVRLGPELEAARANLAAVERQRDNHR